MTIKCEIDYKPTGNSTTKRTVILSEGASEVFTDFAAGGSSNKIGLQHPNSSTATVFTVNSAGIHRNLDKCDGEIGDTKYLRGKINTGSLRAKVTFV